MMYSFKYFLILIFIFLVSVNNTHYAYGKSNILSKYSLDKDMGDSPVFVELFSSQSCVFCPAADNFFDELVKSGKIIGLSCHVNYYNKEIDKMGSASCTKRQKIYIKQLESGTYFTPQIIINGNVSHIGYKYDDIVNSIISYSKSKRKKIDIVVNNKEMNKFSISIDEIKINKSDKYSLYLGLYKKPINMIIESGRNKGKSIIYNNMIERIEKIDDFNGNKKDIIITLDLINKDGGFVVFLQNNNTGNILASGEYKIK